MIEISVEHRDPKVAADIANAIVLSLQSIGTRLAMTEASRRRLYFEKQLVLAKQSLAQSEGGLKGYQDRTGFIQPDEQGGATLGAMNTIEATISAKEVQVNAMKAYATQNNPDYVRAQRELEGLRAELAKLRGKGRGKESGATIAKDRLPEVGLEFSRKKRDLKYHETIYEITAKQYEMARSDEAKEGLTAFLEKRKPNWAPDA
jgi:capsule polysaccharide export protein KpsE/RkpR